MVSNDIAEQYDKEDADEDKKLLCLVYHGVPVLLLDARGLQEYQGHVSAEYKTHPHKSRFTTFRLDQS
jgi:hypothetical protein